MTMPFIMAGMPQRFRIDRPKARGTQDLLGPNRKKASHSRHRACAVNIKAFKENTKIQDWRINEMVQVRFEYNGHMVHAFVTTALLRRRSYSESL
jgi:hypothetical protein